VTGSRVYDATHLALLVAAADPLRPQPHDMPHERSTLMSFDSSTVSAPELLSSPTGVR